MVYNSITRFCGKGLTDMTGWHKISSVSQSVSQSVGKDYADGLSLSSIIKGAVYPF